MGQFFLAGVVPGIIGLALGANVVVNVVSLRLHYSDALAVVPVLALLATDVELRLVVRLEENARKLTRETK